MTRTQANSGFSIEELFPAVAAAVEELGAAIEAELRALLAEAAERCEGETEEEKMWGR